jgi:protein adenylyltransferase
VIREHYPHLADAPAPYAALLAEIVSRTARLVAQWQAAGFCHGVMNTDNMSILGLAIDYGPFGFLDGFDWGHVCNHSDETGRYAYNMQPRIALWNLAALAQALAPLIDRERTQSALDAYEDLFNDEYGERLRGKLGLATERDEDAELLSDLLGMMHESRTDYTIFFRRLNRFDSSPGARNDALRDLFLERGKFDQWALRYAARLQAEGSVDAERRLRMDAVNPKYVLRNHLAETAIRKATDERDYTEIERLRLLLARPFDERPEMEAYAGFPPDWASQLSVSCSS